MEGGGYHQEEQVGEVNTLLSIAGEGEDTFQNLVQDRTEEIRYKWRRSPIVLSQTLQNASWLLMSKLNQSMSDMKAILFLAALVALYLVTYPRE